jgi:hypothetical protein
MKKAALIFLSLLISLCVNGQRRFDYYDFGAFVGTMNYNGDVATGVISGYLSEVRPSVGAYLRTTFSSWLSLGLEGSYAFIYSADENHTSAARGLEVRTHMVQLNPFIEMNFSRFGKFRRHQKTALYVKAGGGVNFYNPDVKDESRLSESFTVRPNAYIGFNYFGGMGLKVRTSYRSYMNFEFLGHFTTFDDLEGWEYQENRTSNDFYGGLRIGYNHMFY